MTRAARAALLFSTMLCFALTASPAQAAVGDLVQLPDPFGCFRDADSGGVCTTTRGESLGGAHDVIFSEDGAFAYVAASGAVSTFSRNPSTGRLTQEDCVSLETGCSTPANALNDLESVALSPGEEHLYAASRYDHSLTVFDRGNNGLLTQQPGCVGAYTTDGCVVANGMGGASAVAVSPDGENVYVAGEGGAVAIFDRYQNTGGVQQKFQTDGCVADVGIEDACADGLEIDRAEDIVVSPDGENVYVAAWGSRAIAIFDRDTEGADSGVLTQKPGTAGCIEAFEAQCTPGRGVAAVESVAISPDGKHVYAGSSATNDGLATFDRAADGVLTQKAGAAGCVSEDGNNGGCGLADGVDGVTGVSVSPDGTSVYTTSSFDDAIGIFDRNTTTGVLTQKPRPRGCVTETGSAGVCTVGVGIDGPHLAVASPDGKTVVGAANGAISIFSRSLTAGLPPGGNPPPRQPPPAKPAPPLPQELEVGKTTVRTNATVSVAVFPFGPGLLGFSATSTYTKRPSASRKVSFTAAKARKRVTKAGKVTVVLRANRAARKILKRKGRLKAKLKITFKPTAGKTVTETRRITFKLKRKRKR